MNDIFMNGHALKLSAAGIERQHASNDAGSTNYICLQGLENLDIRQKAELESLDVQVLQIMSDKTYLCRYVGRDLDRIRTLPFVRSVNVYPGNQKTSAHLRDVSRQEGRGDSIPVNVRLHKEADFSSEERASKFLNEGMDEEDDVRGFSESNSIRVAVSAHSIAAFERFDDADQIKEIENMGLNSDKW
ncbi:hypothetical protein NCS52_01463800 [Fusarium sp. LHS14.1]|nr:hypothetical protein NCS52_01463800 [Fusarium sp. LHS14.1]